MAIRLRSRVMRRKSDVAFGLRLVFTLVVTLLAIGASQYMLTGSRLVDRALAHELNKFRSDAVGIQQIYGANQFDQWKAMRDVIGHMAYRPDVRMVRLVSSSGIVVGVGVSTNLEAAEFGRDGLVRNIEGARRASAVDRDHRPLIDEVFASGGAMAGPEPLAHLGDLVFHVPVELGGALFVLEIITNDDVIATQRRDFNRLIATTLAVGVLLGVPVFYFVGGRGLNRRHATALRHSSRDALTGLGNHRGFQEQAQREIDAAARSAHALALALIDLDDFKAVNDTNGHRVGDEVLAEVGRILASGRPQDQAFRVGGDEFALLLPSTDLPGARAACERLREQVERANRGVTLSIGLAELCEGCADVEALWKRADVALYEAKRVGRNRVVAFCDMDEEQAAVSAASTSAVRRLLADGRMGVAFQPIWDLGAQSLLGFEALARPPAESGLGSPLEMFDAADRLGRVAEVDDLCRRAILDSAHDLPDEALLFINLAPATLGHELTAAERLAGQVAEAGLRTDRVVLELTERTVARRSVIVRETSQLRALGFKIAIDDVGAGNSGLELLRHVPVDFVKIDRSVVVAALEDIAARAVLIAIVAFANETGSYVIAEGIEDGQQLSFVRGLPNRDDRALQQIRGAQGYLLGRPGELTAPLSLHAGA